MIITNIALLRFFEDDDTHPYIMMEGHRFSLQKRQDARSRWRCVKHSIGCRAAINLVGDHLVKEIREHNHSGIKDSGSMKSLDYMELKMEPIRCIKFYEDVRMRQVAFVNGYRYGLQNKNGPNSRWRCTKHEAKGCKSALILTGDLIKSVKYGHNHKPNEDTTKLNFIKSVDQDYEFRREKDAEPKASTKEKATLGPILGEKMEPIRCLNFYEDDKSRQSIIANGYRYGAMSSYTGLGSRWRCTKHTKGCKGYLFLIGDQIKKINCAHNHTPGKDPIKNLSFLKSVEQRFMPELYKDSEFVGDADGNVDVDAGDSY